MSKGQNVNEFHLRDLLRTVLHTQLLLQRALGIVIQQFHENTRLCHIDTTGASMYDDTVDLGSNNLAFTILRDNDIDLQSTNAEVPTGTNHGNDQLPDTGARDEVTDVHLDVRTQSRKNIDSRRAN